MPNDDCRSRRAFVADAGKLASLTALAACAPPAVSHGAEAAMAQRPAGGWDLTWVDRLAGASDRAVFDWPTSADPADPIVMELAARYLDNCAAAYSPGSYSAIAVLNIRTTAIAAGMTDAAWSRYALGAEYNVKDPATQESATRNPFWSRAAQSPAVAGVPTLQELVKRGSVILVCDFAMGHLSSRLAKKSGRTVDEVHAELRHSLVPGAYAVPSGIFGLVRAQNAGCAFVRM